MIRALLTIDDVSSGNTVQIVDYLREMDIPVLMFGVGDYINRFHEQALYVLKNGIILGNHSFSHPHFGEISYEEGIDQIEQCEKVLNDLYKEAGVERRYRPFRFPYGDKGGENKEKFQKYLAESGFDKVDDTSFPYGFWKEQGLDKDIDTFWTYDFEEYRIREGSGFTIDDVMKKINDPAPDSGAPLLEDGGIHMLLMHTHDETDRLAPGYYRQMLGYLKEKGVVFEQPRFI
ncbi:MAG: polysaccharide deacetylase family protein [Lachnospiraceae bacterium]|nr:polysaccharide deacetylase family protein [Lachnospiraceae bacterium]